ncbi:F-box/FBD/LRR-repeat protein-like protein [Tanacetum coccineum]
MKGKGKDKAKRPYKTKCPSVDRISNLPSSIIENILCLLPIQEAARTSILSKDWRYNWTKIPKLVFDLNQMFENQLSVLEQLFEDWSSEDKQLMRRCKQFFAMHQVLLMHQGPILEFSFSMTEPYPDETCVEIEQIIIHLARSNNTVKKFTFKITPRDGYSSYELPRSIFLLRHLTHLHIENCTLKRVPTFDGFGSLKTLSLSGCRICEEALLHLIANCPKLDSLCLYEDVKGISKRIDIIELFKSLPVIEYLIISHRLLRDSFVPPKLSTALVNFRGIWLTRMMLLDDYGLEFLILVIRSSPNLEKLGLCIRNHDMSEDSDDSDIESYALEHNSDIWLEHLNELEIRGFANLQHEMDFVKLILAKAPVLMRVGIFIYKSSIDRMKSQRSKELF